MSWKQVASIAILPYRDPQIQAFHCGCLVWTCWCAEIEEEFQKRSSSSTCSINIFHKGLNKYLSAWTPPGMKNSFTAHFTHGEIYCPWCLSRKRLACSLRHPWVQLCFEDHTIYLMPTLLRYGPLINPQLETETEMRMEGGRQRSREEERVGLLLNELNILSSFTFW